MEHLDQGFIEELEGKIDESFQETQPNEKEVKKDQADTESNNKDLADPGPDQDIGDTVKTQHEPETVIFDLTEEELAGGKRMEDAPTLPQLEDQCISSRRYHPMEISTNTIVTKDNVEFCVRKFVKDLKECLDFSNAVSIHFEIKTVEEDPGRRQV